MGFKVTTLYNVPSGAINYYIYVVEHSASHIFETWIDRHFDELGEDLGEHAAIVRGYKNSRMVWEIMEIVDTHGRPKDRAQKFARLFMSSTCLVVSEGPISHGQSRVVVIPVAIDNGRANEHDEEFISRLMGEVVGHIRSGNFDGLVDKLGISACQLDVGGRNWVVSTLDNLNAVTHLRPNIFGIGVNINELITRCLK
jgi:hypothetical protein